MGKGLKAFLSRDYYRKIEKKIDVKPIVACWIFNIGVAYAVFVVAWLITNNPFQTVLYTLMAWACTLSISVLYWLQWINRKLKGGKVKIAASFIIVFMLAVGLLVLWQTVYLLMQVSLL